MGHREHFKGFTTRTSHDGSFCFRPRVFVRTRLSTELIAPNSTEGVNNRLSSDLRANANILLDFL